MRLNFVCLLVFATSFVFADFREVGRRTSVMYLLKNPMSLSFATKTALKAVVMDFASEDSQPNRRFSASYNSTLQPIGTFDYSSVFSPSTTSTRIVMEFAKEAENSGIVQSLVSLGFMEKLRERSLVTYKDDLRGGFLTTNEVAILRPYRLDESNADFWEYNVSPSTP